MTVGRMQPARAPSTGFGSAEKGLGPLRTVPIGKTELKASVITLRGIVWVPEGTKHRRATSSLDHLDWLVPGSVERVCQ